MPLSYSWKKKYEHLKHLISIMPGNIYWKDKSGVFMGCNNSLAKIHNLKSPEEIIGLSDYDMLAKNEADAVVHTDNVVMTSGKEKSLEEKGFDEKGHPTVYLTRKVPFTDASGNILGMAGISIDITAEKEAERLRIETELQKLELKEKMRFLKIVNQAAHNTQSPLAILLILANNCIGLSKEKIFSTLNAYTEFVPVGIYWLDANNILIGVNKAAVAAAGGVSADYYIGKTPYDYLPYEYADNIVKHNNEVMRIGSVLSQEEPVIDFSTGQPKYFTAFKAPLYDDTGKIIGIIGTSVDITAAKDAERLKLENELQKAKLAEQEEFKKIVDQVVHDIRSPLASTDMILKACGDDIPETIRVVLRESSATTIDIANNLLKKYRKEDSGFVSKEREPMVVSLALLQLLSEKRYQYKELPVKFDYNFCSKCNVTFIRAEPVAFKRMMSNLINNAVDALGERGGKVDLKLELENKNLKIIVKDNGKGMNQEIIDKIMNDIAVTHDKKEGNGIGYTQIRDALEYNDGKIEIKSELDVGTQVILTFSTIESPNWIAEAIRLNHGDTVVVLDDDNSIHGAWDEQFKKHTNEVHLEHFNLAKDAIDFINKFPEKEKIFLLTDFELLKQELNGAHVIEETNIKRCLLVTSHYNNKVIRDLAAKSEVKILPKPLASEIPIEIKNSAVSNKQAGAKAGQKLEMVIIDDSPLFADSLAKVVQAKFPEFSVVDVYYKPKSFLENISKYSKNVRICIDNDYGGGMNGFELAKQLYALGYGELYMLSGREFNKDKIPDYLTVIPKTDTDKFYDIIK